MDWIQAWDEKLFVAINQEWAQPWLDGFMTTITNLHNVAWVKFGVLPALLLWWGWREGKGVAKVVAAFALTLAVTDTLSYRLLKEVVARPRPNHVESLHAVVRLPHRPRSYSLPSNHALNSFALATVASFYYPVLSWLFFAVASVVAVSRVYVGVHFVTDVLIGAALGVLMAFLLKRWLLARVRWFGLKPKGAATPGRLS